jgi:hypothetical protein
LIFIAGNEPFTQGPVPFRTACSLAKEKSIVVNTIFCGDFNEGQRSEWQAGATLTGGTYMSIEQNQKTVYIPTPYDERIETMNDRLNDTYVYYGASGEKKKEAQIVQDNNAERYGKANKVDRAVSKSSHAYKNSTWDVVDAAKDDEKFFDKTTSNDLPAEMKGMSVEQRKVYVQKKSAERKQIQDEIQSLNKKRQEYINTHTPKEAKDAMLDAALIQSIRKQAAEKNLSWQ